MRWIVMVLIMVACILLVICYALMVMAHDADERAEKFYITADRKTENSSEKPNNSKIPTSLEKPNNSKERSSE